MTAPNQPTSNKHNDRDFALMLFFMSATVMLSAVSWYAVSQHEPVRASAQVRSAPRQTAEAEFAVPQAPATLDQASSSQPKAVFADHESTQPETSGSKSPTDLAANPDAEPLDLIDSLTRRPVETPANLGALDEVPDELEASTADMEEGLARMERANRRDMGEPSLRTFPDLDAIVSDDTEDRASGEESALVPQASEREQELFEGSFSRQVLDDSPREALEEPAR